MARRVAVIGAGSSGLTSVKCCVDEGLEPVCFEGSDDIGGLWKFKEEPVPERSSMYRSLIVNTSKEMMCFSDFPMPAHYSNYISHTKLLQYLKLYAENFHLYKYIHFQWEVVTENKDGHKETQVFDGVLVCTGHFTCPTTPLSEFPGIKTFPGKCYHSWEYKDPQPFTGKKVVVIGIGNSGGDIAVEISRVAEQTFLSIRNGAWIMSRMSNGGLPLDLLMTTRFNNLLFQLLPRAVLNFTFEWLYNQKYNHRLYGLQPRHRIFDQIPIINDDLPSQILQGALQVKPNIREFKGSTVIFDNEAIEEEVDVVVFCTGYKLHFPFLPTSLRESLQNEPCLFRNVFPLSLERPTLGFMGLLNPTGPIMPTVELQARWYTRILAGLNSLPSLATMKKMTEKDLKEKMKRGYCPRKAALAVDYVPYMDSIAEDIGVHPNLRWLIFTDPVLAWKIFFGPCTPYHYRLFGPGRWAGARHAIFTQWDRVTLPMMTRPIPESKSSSILQCLGLAGGAVLLFAVISWQSQTEPLMQKSLKWMAMLSDRLEN